MNDAMKMIRPSLEDSLETLLAQEESMELRMLGRPITVDHGWHTMGYYGCEILEYRELNDTMGLRSMRFTRPAGTWTMEKLCECVEIIERILRSRPTLEEIEE